MTVSHLLLVLGVALLSFGLRTLRWRWLQKLGTLGILATSFLIGWLFTGYWQMGAVLMASWLFLPWWEILTRTRKLTLPTERQLRHKTPPNAEAFPTLADLTDEIEDEGFEHIEDAGWDWEDYQQFFRIFSKPAERTHAAICMIDQSSVAFFYLSISSRGKDGRIWTTLNFPFSSHLKLTPQSHINRLTDDQTFLQMYESHRSFLQANGVFTEDLEALDGEQIQAVIAQDFASQIKHNLRAGVLTRNAEGEVRYSWRGLFYIWVQFLRDLVRLS